MTWDEDRQEFICPECESKVWNDVRFIYAGTVDMKVGT